MKLSQYLKIMAGLFLCALEQILTCSNKETHHKSSLNNKCVSFFPLSHNVSPSVEYRYLVISRGPASF